MGAAASISTIGPSFCGKFIPHEMPLTRATMSAATKNFDEVNEIRILHAGQRWKLFMEKFLCSIVRSIPIVSVFMKYIFVVSVMIICSSCGWRKGKVDPLPRCLVQKIDSLSQINERPISVTRYDYRGQTVYYLKSACCDRYNPVFDKSCLLMGHPDGGLTGKGDGSLPGFRDSARNPVVIWRINQD